ncbi:MAG TPA: hypothetical protein PKD00_05690 [Burkholderiales bacterium]|nr:hypothetical protein [Burkholderiales bacterium]
MNKIFFGLAMADSMFPSECTISRQSLSLDELKGTLAGGVEVCLNPSHKATISAMEAKFGLVVDIPAEAPKVALTSGDKLVLFSVRGLPRLGGDRAEYTAEEIEGASFAFCMWTVA